MFFCFFSIWHTFLKHLRIFPLVSVVRFCPLEVSLLWSKESWPRNAAFCPSVTVGKGVLWGLFSLYFFVSFFFLCLHPRKLTWHPKMDPWKRRFLLETIIFEVYVSFLGCICHMFFIYIATAGKTCGIPGLRLLNITREIKDNVDDVPCQWLNIWDILRLPVSNNSPYLTIPFSKTRLWILFIWDSHSRTLSFASVGIRIEKVMVILPTTGE